jgi:hypothetical protein
MEVHSLGNRLSLLTPCTLLHSLDNGRSSNRPTRASTSMMGQAIVMMRQQMMSQPPLHGCKMGSSPAPAAGCKVFSLRLWCRVQGTPALKDGKGKTKETKRKRLWSCAVFEGPLWWKTERAKQRRQRGNDFSTCRVRGTPVLEDGKGKRKEMTGIDFDVLPLGAVSHTSTWHLVSPPVRAPARGQFDSTMTNTGQFSLWNHRRNTSLRESRKCSSRRAHRVGL